MMLHAGCEDGFPCDNGECTSSIFDRCNGVRDCSDGSDEDNCGKLKICRESANLKCSPPT